MSSLHVPPAPVTPEDGPRANEHQPAEAPAVTEKLPLLRVEEPLKAVTRWTPVTWLLVAANVSLFAVMALAQQRVFDFSSHCLLTWGGGLAPRVFGAEWWRAASHMFVHGDLAHLASNMLFLLLAGPFVERLLGPVRFALVYLFAGLGGGLLSMGTSPQHVVIGASAAVFGVYGALLGCCLRGPRSIPWRMVGQRAGWLLAYTVVSLLSDWLDFTGQPVAHLGGFVFGLAGGLLCGHKLQPRAARWRLWRLGVVAALCAGIIGLTARGVYRCSSTALEYYRQYAAVKDRERELRGGFPDGPRRAAPEPLDAVRPFPEGGRSHGGQPPTSGEADQQRQGRAGVPLRGPLRRQPGGGGGRPRRPGPPGRARLGPGVR
jgi:rhomboid protease GluP